MLEGNINILEQAILLTEEEYFKKLNEEKYEETLERIREIVSKSLTAFADMTKEVISRITFSNLLSNFNDNIEEGMNNENKTNINCLSLFYLTPYRKPYKIKKN